MKRNYWMMMLCLLAGGIAGCSDDDKGPTWRELFDEERILVREFMKDKSPRDSVVFDVEFDKQKFQDVAYVFNYSTDDSKKQPQDGQFILVNYTDRTLTGSILDDTRVSVIGGEKIQNPKYPMGGPVYEQVISDEEVYSHFFKYFREGTSGSIILSRLLRGSSTYLYREYKVEKIIEGSLLDYEYELMDEFLKAKGFDRKNSIEVPSKMLNDTVTRIVKFEEISSASILPTDSVTVHCNGYILDEFSDNFNEDKLRAVLKMDEEKKETWKVSDLIEGLKVGLTEMNVGEKAYILIPSGRAYGKGILNYYYQYVMPPYATLVYEIEIFNRKPNAK
ncbi:MULTISPECIES: FKBP-type peptidyl-prolyl cis-trans isomerase [Butyricimonas]|uniref:FKBP-type peptidyl-prolyl cis-trans isomerase n=1 Tax=Butyricimonas TaxID=574697 RepID=UPI001D08998F|nr:MULTISPECIES: FKBP-type peptidyl-prolyl cis-trans isomerase [Butyricimonas]MCB6971951.1 FKBP-type peptidyl-prolyl cis-trans isomerase [Butyricimonas synergistica]MCG4518959.1 FKBP-type peptidyl-prolyl cis-trans isomerase [Butyricimonas sp. DFI.6.44]